MPIIPSSYKKPLHFLSKHIETIYPVLFRKTNNVYFQRERFFTPDDDFIDLDWIKNKSKRLVMIQHGLEGSTESKYLKGMARALSNEGFDVLAWNYRSCSGEINKQYRFYHSGETGDLELVLNKILPLPYEEIFFIGFSVGGNITLKFLGEKQNSFPEKVKAAVTFSVPCDLESGAYHLAKFKNKIYMQRFIKSLKRKVKEKSKMYPSLLRKELNSITNFPEFDELYTAPIHGFKDAKDYWKKNSSRFYIPYIKIPTLIVNAQNDPFLTPACFPIEECRHHAYVSLEMPRHGGHCGFYQKNEHDLYWSEARAIEFINYHSKHSNKK